MGLRLWVAAWAGVVLGCSASHPRTPYQCDPNPCDDDDPCNGAEVCDSALGCMPGEPPDCDDYDPCSRDSCTAGECRHEPTDRDGDGFADACAGGDDCAAMDPSIHPGAEEVCNGADDDCDGRVDEDGALGILEERSLAVDDALGWSGPEALLDDGRAIGWSARGLLAASPEGMEERDLGGSEDDSAPDVVGPAYAAAVRGGQAVLARLWGEVRASERGAASRDRESIAVYSIASGEALPNEPWLVEPAPGQRAWTAPLALSWQHEAPTLAWHAWIGGRPKLVAAYLGVPDAIYYPATPHGDVDDLALAEDPEGTTVLWAETGPGGRALPHVSTTWNHAESLDSMPGGVSACTLGRTIVLASGTEISRLDRSFARTSLAQLDEGPIELRCAGSTIWALAPGQLVHLLEDGLIDFVDGNVPEASRLVASSTGVWLGGHGARQDEWILRRYGCEP